MSTQEEKKIVDEELNATPEEVAMNSATTEEANEATEESQEEPLSEVDALKKQLAEDIVNKIAPIRERIVEYSSNTELLKKIAKEGADKARESAAKTLKEVQQIIGFTSL